MSGWTGPRPITTTTSKTRRETVSPDPTSEGVEAIARFHELLGAHVEDPPRWSSGSNDRGLFVAALVAARYQVYAVNPLSTRVTATGMA